MAGHMPRDSGVVWLTCETVVVQLRFNVLNGDLGGLLHNDLIAVVYLLERLPIQVRASWLSRLAQRETNAVAGNVVTVSAARCGLLDRVAELVENGELDL